MNEDDQQVQQPDNRGTGRGLAGAYLPELIYGATDGVVTTFAIVAGVVGANLSTRIVLILGLASLFADGLSMAASDFLAERSRPGGPVKPGPAARHGLATFVGFIAVGIVPLIAYILPIDEAWRFWAAGGLTLGTLFVVGALRSLAAEHIRWFRGGAEMLTVGAAAAGVAYGIGALISAVAPQAGRAAGI